VPVDRTSSSETNQSATKWWGWGLESKTYPLDDKPQFWPYLLKTLKLTKLNECPRVMLEDVKLPKSRLNHRTLTRLKRAVGADISTEKYDRLTHSLGKSYLGLLNLRRGLIRNSPDAVVYPKDEREVAKLLSFARVNRISVVPFAGGSSVVGGVEPKRPKGVKGAITVDLRRMNRVLDLDAVSLTATVEAGISGPRLEDELNAKGFTLGHFPQSFQFSVLGGWIATRSAGQVSTKYGKIEDMVESITLVSPTGKLDTKAVPASASGPELKQVLVGSEGTLGVITKAKLRIHRIPLVRRYEGLMFKSFRDGITAIRETMQSGLIPAMMRLSDPDETTVSLMLSSQGVTTKLGLWMLERLGYVPTQQCVMILGVEGEHSAVKAERQVAIRACKRNGAFAIGKGVGRTWLDERFELPYLRDVLLDHCILIDTLETATTWDKLEALHGAIKK
jgi:alkyldihydroxyacetonephosphate synthase